MLEKFRTQFNRLDLPKMIDLILAEEGFSETPQNCSTAAPHSSFNGCSNNSYSFSSLSSCQDSCHSSQGSATPVATPNIQIDNKSPIQIDNKSPVSLRGIIRNPLTEGISSLDSTHSVTQGLYGATSTSAGFTAAHTQLPYAAPQHAGAGELNSSILSGVSGISHTSSVASNVKEHCIHTLALAKELKQVYGMMDLGEEILEIMRAKMEEWVVGLRNYSGGGKLRNGW